MRRLPSGGARRWWLVLALVAIGVAGCGGGGGGGGLVASSVAVVDTYNPLVGSPNPIDQAALATLQSAGLASARLSDDSEFLRRVTADIAGRFPTEDELAKFAADKSPDKRTHAIDALLVTNDFFAHWAKDVIGPWVGVTEDRDAFDQAVQVDLSQDISIGQIVDALCVGEAPQFDKTFDKAYMKVDRLVLAFTGMTSQCARCHDHKLTSPDDDPRFVQDDNYALYAFFAESNGDATKVDLAGKKFGKAVPPGFVLDGYAKAPTSGLPDLTAPVGVRRQTFSMLLRKSHAFHRGTAHRIWAEVSSPLLDPNQFLKANLDTMTAPAVLEALAKTFEADGTSLRRFLHDVLSSRLYQLSSETGAVTTAWDGIARHKVRRHHAEVLERGFAQLAGVDANPSDFFRANFGYPLTRDLITERSDEVNVAQAAVLMNSDSVAGVVSQGPTVSKLADQVDRNEIGLDAAIRTLFRRALGREPGADELSAILAEAQQCQAQRSTQDALEDVAAGIMASIEFVGH